jgi:hypothetical protein
MHLSPYMAGTGRYCLSDYASSFRWCLHGADVTTAPRPPANLGKSGAKLWRAIAGKYELRADEQTILGDAVRERDLIDRLEDELRTAPLLVPGSRPGMLVGNPLVSELRMHRSTLAGLLKALAIPDDDATGARMSAARSQQTTRAARARWDRQAGRG